MDLTPYAAFIQHFVTLSRQRLSAPSVVPTEPHCEPVRDAARRCALVFAPHPDDECLMSGLTLRLKHQDNWQIVNVAVTLGSNVARRQPRWEELRRACAVLDYDLMAATENGFDRVRPETRDNDPAFWAEMVQRVADIIARFSPDMICVPHGNDLHDVHVGTRLLVMDALKLMPATFSCQLTLMEYWHPNEKANLMLGLSVDEAARLLAALTCHEGETARNPYDSRLPALLIDNVRRGSELLSGRGTVPPSFDLALLYQTGLWQNASFTPHPTNRFLAPNESAEKLLFP